jgi:hypothetical protein
MTRTIWLTAACLLAGCLFVSLTPALAQNCARTGAAIACDDGRVGTFTGESIVWPDGTTSRPAQHPSVIIGNKPSIRVGPGVFVGQGKGSVPLDDPNAPNKQQCAIVDNVPYCH